MDKEARDVSNVMQTNAVPFIILCGVLVQTCSSFGISITASRRDALCPTIDKDARAFLRESEVRTCLLG